MSKKLIEDFLFRDNKLNESPDEFEYEGVKYSVEDEDAYAFVVELNRDTDRITDVRIAPGSGYHGTYPGVTHTPDAIYPGRLFMIPKIITFWVYPSDKELVKIVKIMERKLNIKMFNNGWKIEVYHQVEREGSVGKLDYFSSYDRYSKDVSFVPIEKYVGSNNVPADIRMTHLDKQHLRKGIKGFGSEHRKQLSPLAWRQAQRLSEYIESIYDFEK